MKATVKIMTNQNLRAKVTATTGSASVGRRGSANLAKDIKGENIIQGGRIVNTNIQPIQPEEPMKAQFFADLKKASAKVKPGRKMSHEESAKDILETYPGALKSLRD